jgi:hypothetical protein
MFGARAGCRRPIYTSSRYIVRNHLAQLLYCYNEQGNNNMGNIAVTPELNEPYYLNCFSPSLHAFVLTIYNAKILRSMHAELCQKIRSKFDNTQTIPPNLVLYM